MPGRRHDRDIKPVERQFVAVLDGDIRREAIDRHTEPEHEIGLFKQLVIDLGNNYLCAEPFQLAHTAYMIVMPVRQQHVFGFLFKLGKTRKYLAELRARVDQYRAVIARDNVSIDP